jgi:tetratricopeptide (TPR) repeat protein
VLLRDLFEYEAAEALLLDNLKRQRELRQDRRELAKTQGNLGELWTFMGRFDEAEASLTEALESLRAVYPDEVPRELCYLGNLALRRGEPRQAVAIYDEGLAANSGVTYGRERNETFLRYGLVRAHVELSELDAAMRQANRALAPLPTHELYPRQLILKFRGLAAVGLGQLEAGESDLRAAAERTYARGSLAEIAAGTSLAELALVLLEIPGRELEALELVRQLLGLGGRLMQRMDPPGTELVGPPADIRGLKRKLAGWLDRFPY